MSKTKQMTLLALFTTIALTIFIVESAIPALVPIPGVKLGLANIVTLFLISSWNRRSAFTVLIMRLILGSIFAGQAIYFLYSLAGGLLCFFIMSVLHTLLGTKLLWFTSIAGAVAHNVGQIIMAYFLMDSPYIFSYLPFLVVSAIITGLFTGLCVTYLSHHLKFSFKK